MVVGEDSKCVLEGGGVLPPPELLQLLLFIWIAREVTPFSPRHR